MKKLIDWEKNNQNNELGSILAAFQTASRAEYFDTTRGFSVAITAGSKDILVANDEQMIKANLDSLDIGAKPSTVSVNLSFDGISSQALQKVVNLCMLDREEREGLGIKDTGVYIENDTPCIIAPSQTIDGYERGLIGYDRAGRIEELFNLNGKDMVSLNDCRDELSNYNVQNRLSFPINADMVNVLLGNQDNDKILELSFFRDYYAHKLLVHPAKRNEGTFDAFMTYVDDMLVTPNIEALIPLIKDEWLNSEKTGGKSKIDQLEYTGFSNEDRVSALVMGALETIGRDEDFRTDSDMFVHIIAGRSGVLVRNGYDDELLIPLVKYTNGDDYMPSNQIAVVQLEPMFKEEALRMGFLCNSINFTQSFRYALFEDDEGEYFVVSDSGELCGYDGNDVPHLLCDINGSLMSVNEMFWDMAICDKKSLSFSITSDMIFAMREHFFENMLFKGNVENVLNTLSNYLTAKTLLPENEFTETIKDKIIANGLNSLKHTNVSSSAPPYIHAVDYAIKQKFSQSLSQLINDEYAKDFKDKGREANGLQKN